MLWQNLWNQRVHQSWQVLLGVSVLPPSPFWKYHSVYPCSWAMQTGLFAMNCCNSYERAYPKKIKSLCQSIFAVLEQCAYLSLMEELLNLAAALMCLHKGMDFVEGPERRWSVWWLDCCSQKKYSVNFPMWFNVLGGNTPLVSELTWRMIIAPSNSCVCSINSKHVLLFFLTVCVRFMLQWCL
jgi:hypothetical protein